MAADQSSTGADVTGKVTRLSQSHKKRWLLVLGCLLIAVFISFAISKQFQQNAILKTAQNNAEFAIQNGQQYKTLQNQARVESANGQYSQAADAFVAYSQKTSDKVFQVRALEDAGRLYFSGGNFKKALDSFQHAAEINGLTYNQATEIANAAMRAGDKTLAVQYFQKALQLMPAKLPNRQDKVRILNVTIKRLQQSTT